MRADLAHIDTWIFDLDNTLYPASTNLFARIDERIGAYVARLFDCDPIEARRIQKDYFHRHGTTLAGLMAEHDVDPIDYLDDVHDIALDQLERDAPLVAGIAALPGRKLVFTNADAPYARRVLARLGLDDSFEALFDLRATNYTPKPHPDAYAGLCAAYDLDPARCLFADDMARNLAPAKAIGMTTVWVDNGSEQGIGEDRSFVDHKVADIAAWLHTLQEEE
ncbi:putative hydrolase of the HAD superfamily [Hephaestia caeni]|uniref:Putative hydrolase of the HAD superfamily n=1 Tax=Hephaestia caeni TaxID=645617 RepID=A0A397NDF2_9SPHN|nr:pyrimidine 5'-nucleotidase [Hephaestia caeni]RIA35500.1 putative hydrolase of the HAD superfamily [Hephaestia caeni]